MPDNWPVEEIPNQAILFRRLHKNNVGKKNNLSTPPPAAFKNSPIEDPDLSTDWNKYTTPQGVLELISKEYVFNTSKFKDSSKFYIISVNVGEVLSLKINQTIQHTPKQLFPEVLGNPNNRSHSSIIGDKTDEEIRLKLAGISLWEIGPE